MMYGHEKSDHAIVAVKPANKAERPSAERSAAEPNAAESGEPRAGTKGNADQQSTRRTLSRISVSQALERIRKVAVTHPRWEPYAGKPHVRFCAGGVR
jgi:RNA-directed DNA polymerase